MYLLHSSGIIEREAANQQLTKRRVGIMSLQECTSKDGRTSIRPHIDLVVMFTVRCHLLYLRQFDRMTDSHELQARYMITVQLY